VWIISSVVTAKFTKYYSLNAISVHPLKRSLALTYFLTHIIPHRHPMSTGRAVASTRILKYYSSSLLFE